MTDSAPTSADLPAPHRNPDQDRIDPPATDGAPASRFGEAAHLLDRLDLRPQEQRQPPRPLVAHLVTASAAVHPHPARAPRPGWQPAIDAAKCTGCGWCVAICPPHVLSLAVTNWKKSSHLHAPQSCTGCSECAVVCPFHAIRMHKRSD